jgi:hypothetical protein
MADLLSWPNVARAVLIIICLWLIYHLIKALKIRILNMKYVKDVHRYITVRDAKLDAFLVKHSDSVPLSTQNRILSYKVSQLISQMQEGSLTSEEIVITYGIRLATIGRRLNLIADIDLEHSLALARQKDNERRSCNDPSTLPPLHGLPITIKDHLMTEGFRDTIGFAANLRNSPASGNCFVIDLLRRQGAIPLAKSNVPFGLARILLINRGAAEEAAEEKEDS